VNLSANSYPLNLQASVFYVDSLNTGFSKPSAENLTDVSDAQNNIRALQDIVKKFPIFANKSFWLMGEGYGGV